MGKKLLVHLTDKHVDAIEAIIRNGLAKSQTGAIQYALMVAMEEVKEHGVVPDIYKINAKG